MANRVHVSGEARATATTAAAAEGADGGAAKLDPNATPPAAWHPYDPTLAPAPGGKGHKLT